MTLIKSISGIRGTIGGKPGENLTPVDMVQFSVAYAQWLKNSYGIEKPKIVLGRDARVSGPILSNVVIGTLNALGVDVINLNLASTPTTEMAVVKFKADGGIILTASHNPANWNALKLLNNKGEFISAEDGKVILEFIEKNEFNFEPYTNIGSCTEENADDYHLQKILELDLVDLNTIKKRNFKVAIDCVNSVGGIIIPELLRKLGVTEIIEMNCEPTGIFAHNPEPLPENLMDISNTIKEKKADLGFVVDPDVDRLAIVNEDGTMFGEEYTLVAIADYILQHTKGNTVSNLSSTRALSDVTVKYQQKYEASAVGEVNVVTKMKEINAVIGGEGNGGIIYPELHYGRDALVGIALFLTYLAKKGCSCSELKKSYPAYTISKNKIELTPEIDVDQLLVKVQKQFKNERINLTDGVKIDFENEWVHLRKSNTEPIIRIYAESATKQAADDLADRIIKEIRLLI